MNSIERILRAVLSRLAPMLLLAAVSSPAQAQVIGRVLIAVGEVSAARGGQAVTLGTGSAVENGDTIRVGTASNAQIRFNDEGIVALRPQTVFRIEEYNYAGRQDGAEKAAFNLIEGGMRTITGLIGKLNRGNYLVRTPTSTIGIRGTNYNLVQCDASCVNKDGSRPRPGTYGGVYDGSIGVTNRSGEKTFGAEEFFYVAGPTTPPQTLLAPPSFLQDRLEGTSRRANQRNSVTTETAGQSGAGADGRAQTTSFIEPPILAFVSTEQKTASGASSVLGATEDTQFLLAFNTNGSGGYGANIGGALKAGQTFSGTDLTAVTFAIGGGNAVASLGGGSITDTAYFSAINGGYGRWMGGTVTASSQGPVPFVPTTGIHYLYADKPNENIIASRTGVVSFSLVGGTSPTDSTGAVGTMFGTSMSVDFTTRTATLSAGWSVGAVTYALANSPLTFNGTAGFSANLSNSATTNCIGGGCGGGTTIQSVGLQGGIIGKSSDHIGMNIVTDHAALGAARSTASVQVYTCIPSC